MKKRALMPLAPGFEEIEALAVVDILRRAGIEVVTAGIVEGAIEGRSGIKVIPDALFSAEVDDPFDILILPGGQPGTDTLASDVRVIKMVIEYINEKKVAAICAAPTILKSAEVSEGRRLTCHPSVRESFTEEQYRSERVVIDDNLITSQGPGTAIEFAYAIVTELLGDTEKAGEVNQGVLARV